MQKTNVIVDCVEMTDGRREEVRDYNFAEHTNGWIIYYWDNNEKFKIPSSSIQSIVTFIEPVLNP